MKDLVGGVLPENIAALPEFVIKVVVGRTLFSGYRLEEFSRGSILASIFGTSARIRWFDSTSEC